MIIHSAFLLLAQTDGDLLRTIKEPGFSEWFTYLLVFLLIVERLKSWVDRDKPKRTEVSGSVETSPKTTFATTAEVAALKTEVQGLSEEGEARHTEAKRLAEHRVTDLSRVMDEETEKIGNKIDRLTEKFEGGIETLRDKIDDAILLTTAHHAEIPHLKERLHELTERYNKDFDGMQRRIDDAIKAATQRGKA